MNPQAPRKTLLIVSGYEGLSGLRSDGRYYPYWGKADPPGVLTIGRGHKLSAQDVKSGRFNSGLTLAEVDQLFLDDLQPRAVRLDAIMRNYNEDQFAGALSSFYNLEKIWTVGTPGRDHTEGKFKECAATLLLYIYADGQKRLGLWRRRMSEALCYLTGEVIVAKDDQSERLLQSKLQQLIQVVKPAGLS